MVPNPASDDLQLSIENDSLESIAIIDVKGSILISEEKLSSSEITIAVNELSRGLYIVRILSENGKMFIKKLVIK